MFNKSIFKASSFILIIFLAMPVFAQQNDELIQRFLEQRKRMMEEIMKSFGGNDPFLDNDFFGDDFFEEFKKHGIGGLKGFQHQGQLVSVEEKINKDGSIDLLIKPKDKNIKLDIQTTDDSIIIKGETFVSEDNKSDNGQSRSMFKSTFSRSIPIPTGYQAMPASAINDGLMIKLVQKNKNFFKKSPNKNIDKKPVGKLPGEKTI